MIKKNRRCPNIIWAECLGESYEKSITELADLGNSAADLTTNSTVNVPAIQCQKRYLALVPFDGRRALVSGIRRPCRNAQRQG